MLRTRRNLLALVCLSLLAACGLKGPLYSPDEPAEEVAPAPAPGESTSESTSEASGEPSTKRPAMPIPAPQSQKKDRPQNGATQQAPASDTTPPTSPPDPDRPATPAPVPPPRQ